MVIKRGKTGRSQTKLNTKILTMQMEPVGEKIVPEEVQDQSGSEFESEEEEYQDWML